MAVDLATRLRLLRHAVDKIAARRDPDAGGDLAAADARAIHAGDGVYFEARLRLAEGQCQAALLELSWMAPRASKRCCAPASRRPASPPRCHGLPPIE